jgi:hypothetical protein
MHISMKQPREHHIGINTFNKPFDRKNRLNWWDSFSGFYLIGMSHQGQHDTVNAIK